MNNRYERKILT